MKHSVVDRTIKSVTSQYDRSVLKYMQMKCLDQCVGTGGDMTNLTLAEKLQVFDKQLHLAVENGKDVGKLSARTVEKWYRLGWFKLFDSRCGSVGFVLHLCL